MGQLSPVGGDHVGGRGKARRPAEFSHHLASGEPLLCPARILGIGHDASHVAHQAYCVLQQPAPIRIERDARLREPFVQGRDGFDLLLRTQDTPLELEVVETIALVRSFGEAHDGLRRQRLLTTQPEPVVAGARITGVRQVCPAGVSDVEQVAQHLHRIALLTFAKQGRNGYVQVLPQQVKQGGLDRRDGMDRGAQVEGLDSPPAGITIGELPSYADEKPLMRTDRLADDEWAGIFERLANFLATGHLADAGAPRRVGQQQQVAGEERSVGAAQIEQHAVVASDRNDGQGCNDGSGRARHAGLRWFLNLTRSLIHIRHPITRQMPDT